MLPIPFLEVNTKTLFLKKFSSDVNLCVIIFLEKSEEEEEENPKKRKASDDAPAAKKSKPGKFDGRMDMALVFTLTDNLDV